MRSNPNGINILMRRIILSINIACIWNPNQRKRCSYCKYPSDPTVVLGICQVVFSFLFFFFFFSGDLLRHAIFLFSILTRENQFLIGSIQKHKLSYVFKYCIRCDWISCGTASMAHHNRTSNTQQEMFTFSLCERKSSTKLPAKGGIDSASGQKHPGKLTPFVLVTWIVAAMGGSNFWL